MEQKNMDTCLRRLKQEILSMKEAGDGLHAQMNSMMGALQELKLLQVQTALEQMEISGRGGRAAQPVKQGATQPALHLQPQPEPQVNSPPPLRVASREEQEPARQPYRSSSGTSPSLSSLDSESFPLPMRVSGYTAPQVEYCGPRLGQPPEELQQQNHPGNTAHMVDLPGILYSLSKEGPSLDSVYSQDSMDDSSDWTSSLMSCSRNRQPLVLGDNVFADLVGNWLDLPELENSGDDDAVAGGGHNKPDSPAHPLRPSRSQEICRRFSLTTNIFKKFLRSVRPDRDKLLKEKPGWMPTDNSETELFKRPKKATKSKGSFYLPFWAGGQQGKGRPGPTLVEERLEPHYSGIYIDQRHSQNMEKVHPRYHDRRQTERVLKAQPLFDYNTAVWV
ncbi:PAK4-inhibitor INKA2-like [Denticeps clupeoides]|uniref:PAK4-inhibitor INKA2 n=1 Tax=Denticeps clupeoides TaxID=299321 RepID=A0AAY4EVP4_9TELE|nr:PAK4-inhibitor INKA2-like [Denticeps clupeoides]